MRATTLKPGTVLLVLALGLVGAGCFKADMAVRVEEDGSGEIGWLIALDTEAALGLGSAFATDDVPELSVDEACADFRDQQEVPEGAVVVPYDEDGFCGLRYSVQFDAGGFEQALADSDTEVGTVELSSENGGWYFELSDTGGMTGDLDTGDEFGAALLDDAEFTIRVFLPGRLVDHNATYIDGDGNAVWEIDLQGSTTRLFARTEPGETIRGSGGDDGSSGGGSSVALVLIVGAVLLVGVAVVIFVRRRQAPAPPSDPSASNLPPPPPGAPES